jgi:hypothetical protein
MWMAKMIMIMPVAWKRRNSDIKRMVIMMIVIGDGGCYEELDNNKESTDRSNYGGKENDENKDNDQEINDRRDGGGIENGKNYDHQDNNDKGRVVVKRKIDRIIMKIIKIILIDEWLF